MKNKKRFWIAINLIFFVLNSKKLLWLFLNSLKCLGDSDKNYNA